ncbi:MAG TPA: histidine phosphatase family protein [Acidimicrobiia bacterium]|nr:histidine phosphatase family protein [Acidimicrobiia bacterium]
MTVRITLVRHARSEANEAEIWQGQGDAPLSQQGRSQAAALGKRLAGRSFDLVVSSDLARAHATALAAGHPVETDPVWREINLGDWEGRTFAEVAVEHPDLLEAIRGGEAVRFGEVGESIQEFEDRAFAALDALVGRVGSGSVAVVTHGGIIDAIAGRLIGRTNRRTYPIVANTALTEVRYEAIGDRQPRYRLQTFNDATHLGWDEGFLGRMRSEGRAVVGLVRHGVTRANQERRIQGQTCWGLDDVGHDQARRFARSYGRVDRIWSSPIQRAMETASALAPPTATPDDDLKEMGFGSWEGANYDDLLASGDETARRIFIDGEDLPRGGAESFADVAKRMRAFLDRIDGGSTGRRLAVSHGAAIKSVIADMHGRGTDINRDLAVSHNTGVTHIVLTDQGPWLADWSVAPHLTDDERDA